MEEAYQSFKKIKEIEERVRESAQKMRWGIQKDIYQKDELRNALGRLKREASETFFNLEHLDQKARLNAEIQMGFPLKSMKIEEV